jgi:hypothetical protein
MKTAGYVIPQVIRAELSEIRTMCPGKVVSYDAARQTIKAQVLVKTRILNGETGEVTFETPPPIPDVPVAWMQGGGMSFTFPLEPGDPVLLIFSDRSLNEWVASSQNTPQEPFDSRQFDLSDAIAIPGPSSPARALSGHAVDSGAAVLQVAEIRIGDSTVSTFLARADRVEARLQALENYVATHEHTYTVPAIPAAPGPTILPRMVGAPDPNTPSTATGATASDKVKGD